MGRPTQESGRKDNTEIHGLTAWTVVSPASSAERRRWTSGGAIFLRVETTHAPPRRMTIDEWAALDEDEAGELVDGVLVEEEDVGALHEAIVIWLAQMIRNWLMSRGRVLGSDAKLAVSSTRGRKPDLTVFLTRVKLPSRKVIRTPPDIAVEVMSPTPRDRRRDRSDKLVEYAAFGIRYYWVVDPEAQTLDVLERTADGVYQVVLTASAGVVAIPGCVGLSLDLGALWDEIADFDDED
jgi:Uma2 family endonuclease